MLRDILRGLAALGIALSFALALAALFLLVARSVDWLIRKVGWE